MDVIGLENLIELAFDNKLIDLIEYSLLLSELRDLQDDAEAYNHMLYDDEEDE